MSTHIIELGSQPTANFYNDIDIGFCIIEVAFDAPNRQADYRFLEVNSAFEEHTGLIDVTGRWMRNLAPDHEQFWFDRYGSIARTGRPARFEYSAQALGGRHFEVYAYRTGDPEQQRVAVLFADISFRKREERLRKALFDLTDQLAGQEDVAALTDVACGILGRTLGVQLVGYGLVNPVAETITVDHDWTTDGAQSLAGMLQFRDFGSYIDDLKRGETVVVEDARTDPRTRTFAAALEERSARAFVNTPIFERGQFVALQYVSTGEPRVWMEEELRFIREVGVRTRTATARRQAEMALQASEARQRHLLQQMPSFVGVLTGPDHTYAYVNDAYVRTAGPREYLGRRVRDVFPELAGQGFFELLDQVYATGVPFSARTTPVRFAGEDTDRYIDFSFQPTRGDDGTVTGIFVGGYDVTEQQRTALALRELNVDLERKVTERALARGRTWQLSPDIMGVINAQGYFEQSNPAWATVLGWSEAEVASTVFFDFLHPDDVAPAQEAWVAALDLGLPALSFENRYRHKDGGWRWLSWVAVPDDGKVYCSARDITAGKEQASALLRAEDALRQAQKLEAVGQLTGGVAHDFNNLLTVIKSSTDLLKRPNLPEERRVRYVGAISDTVDRAARLTGQLLAFARRQTLKPEVFAACDGVRAITEMVGTLTGARIKLVTDLPEERIFISADPSQFDTALVNMAVNARDAMDGEGQITITVRPADAIPAMRTHPAVAGRFAAISLSDTGTGIAADRLDQIFEPFFTTKEVGKGTGLGLSQVFGFAKQTGGDVMVSSVVGEGTTFTLYLPHVAAGQRETPTKALEPDVLTVGHDTCVLVVEDNADVGGFSVQALIELGFRPILAGNADEALAELETDADRFDVVFTDVVMPGMNGIDLAKEIRHRHPGLPVVLTSGYSHVLAQEGTHGFELLQKPYSADDLSRVFRRVTSRHPHPTPLPD